MHPLHEAVGCWIESHRAGQMDSAYAGQGVEELRFELPARFGGDGLRASVTRYPPAKQGLVHRLRCNVRLCNSFRPARKSVYFRKTVLKPSDVVRGPTMSSCRCWNRVVSRAKTPISAMLSLDIFERWQDWHPRAKARQSFCTPDHAYR